MATDSVLLCVRPIKLLLQSKGQTRLIERHVFLSQMPFLLPRPACANRFCLRVRGRNWCARRQLIVVALVGVGVKHVVVGCLSMCGWMLSFVLLRSAVVLTRMSRLTLSCIGQCFDVCPVAVVAELCAYLRSTTRFL
jgi:hypothetical protein